MEDEEWRMDDGGWRMEDGGWVPARTRKEKTVILGCTEPAEGVRTALGKYSLYYAFSCFALYGAFYNQTHCYMQYFNTILLKTDTVLL